MKLFTKKPKSEAKAYMNEKETKQEELTASQLRKEKRKLAKQEAKKEKIRRQGHNVFWYLNPKNMAKEAELIGGNFSFIDNIFTYILFEGITVLVALLFGLKLPFIIAMCIITFLFIPGNIVKRYRQEYENKRFLDINIYMEQFLYGFREHKKITRALQEMRPSFTNSILGEMIDEAYDKIMNPDMNADKSNIAEEALKPIERVYPTEKLLTIHKFALRVEKIGGDFKETSQLLLEDRANWEARQNKILAEKKQKRVLVNTSIALAIFLCFFFIRIIGTAIPEYSIIDNVVVQLSTLFIWFVDLCIYSYTASITSEDMLALSSQMEEETALRHYWIIEDWDEHKEMLKSLRMAVFPLIGAILFYVLRNKLIFGPKGNIVAAFICLAVSFLFLMQHKIDYNLTKKKVEEEIAVLFPRWLIDIALRMKIDGSPQVALYKSYEDAPAVLKPELKKLYDRLEQNPTSVDPYLNFMQHFNIRGITSSMKLLYNLDQGSGSDSDIQIKEIIERNNEMLGFALEVKAENQIGVYSGLVLTPILSSGAKLSIDMIVFFMNMLEFLNNGVGSGFGG